MLRFPLHTPILLITTGGKFIGRITHAGDEFIKVVDVVERIITSTGDYLFTDNEMSGVFHFERNHIVGFKPLDGSEIFQNEQEYTDHLNKTYNNTLSDTKRSQFKIIKNVNFKPNKCEAKNE